VIDGQPLQRYLDEIEVDGDHDASADQDIILENPEA
jgi:hypothetical protein